MKTMKVKLTFTEDALGMSPNDKELHARYIASNAPDAKTMTEEIEAIGEKEVREREMNVFPRAADGSPMFFDYQIKGFFKDACGALQRAKGEDESKHSCGLKAYKKTIDGCIFVKPRQIKINLAGEIGNLQRSLRASTPQGERIALAESETVPEGRILGGFCPTRQTAGLY